MNKIGSCDPYPRNVWGPPQSFDRHNFLEGILVIQLHRSYPLKKKKKLSVQTLMPAFFFFFQSLINFWNSIFGIAFNTLNDAFLILSMLAKCQSFKVLFIFWNRKKSHWTISEKYGNWALLQCCFNPKIHEQPMMYQQVHFSILQTYQNTLLFFDSREL